jgi:hypothetical protein
MLVGRYVPLLQYLATLPAAQIAVTLSFAELGDLLGRRLSRTAQTELTFWRSSPVAHRNWRRDGWTARLDQLRGTVTFTRSQS